MDKEQFYLNQLQDHVNRSASGASYSIHRIDLLVISISSFGVLFATNILKDYHGMVPILVSIIFFVSSVIINFLSQWTGYYANRTEHEWANEEISVYQQEFDSSDNLKKLDRKAKRYGKWTQVFNITSTIFLFAGIISLAVGLFQVYSA